MISHRIPQCTASIAAPGYKDFGKTSLHTWSDKQENMLAGRKSRATPLLIRKASRPRRRVNSGALTGEKNKRAPAPYCRRCDGQPARSGGSCRKYPRYQGEHARGRTGLPALARSQTHLRRCRISRHIRAGAQRTFFSGSRYFGENQTACMGEIAVALGG